MRRILFIITLSIVSGLLFAQPFNKLGHPFITNFTPEEYNGTEQTWSIAQDDRGVMYFGTYENGILEFDGKSWNKIAVPNNKPVYSMVKGNDGVVYVGTSGDFGYLEPTDNGSIQFISLSNQIHDTIKQNLSHIYKTYYHDKKVYYCSLSYMFIYDGKSVHSIFHGPQKDNANFLTFIVNDKIYVGSYFYGLRFLDKDNKLKLVKGGDAFIEKNIFSILDIKNNELLVVTNEGFYKYNPTNGESNKIDSPNRFIKSMLDQSVIPYYSLTLNNNNVGVGTVQSDWLSFIEFDLNTIPQNIINTSNGLHSAQLTYLYQNGESPVWFTHYDGGISKIENNSNIRRFGKESGINNIITDILRFNGTLYIATMNGVFYLTFNSNGMPEFKPVSGINGVVWSLLVFKTPEGKSKLYAGSYVDGVFEIVGGNSIPISKQLEAINSKVKHQCFYLYQSTSNPNKVFIGMITGLAYMEWRNGKWVNTEFVERDKINFEIRSIGEDKYGNLWLGTNLNGIICITNKGEIKKFDESKGLPSQKQLLISPLNDSLFILTSKGVYHYDFKDSLFKKGGIIGQFANEGIYRIAKTKDGYAALNYSDIDNLNSVQLLKKDKNNQWLSDNKAFKRLPNKWADAMFVDDDGTIWVGMSELYSYNPNIKRKFDTPFYALIRRVVAKDSVLFSGTFYTLTDSAKRKVSLEQFPYQIPKLSYKYNGIVVNFAAPYFEKEGDIVYSHYLEGSDEVTWSKWDSRTEATYTNLREGKYTFHIKAKNIYGDESTPSSYSFELSPPWYRTILAFIFYAILFVGLVWGIVKWNTRRLIAEKEHLEQIVKERTAEVVAQKEEIEVQNEKIAAQNEEIKSSIHYASRIQGAILTPAEQVNRIFPDSFILYLPRDIVSGDFYHITQIGSKKISVVADCTGHGVPGGFMSMLGVSFLTQIISQTGELHASTILNKLRQQVITALHQTGEIGGSKDGMDLALYIFDEQTMKVEFAGANNPLIHISNGELNHIKSDKMPIGIHLRGDTPFTNFEIDVKKGDVLYTFSDGYADQFGGSDARKFMIKNLKDLLLEIHQKPMDEQRDILDKTLLNWHGDTPRIDDVVVMGVRI